jgi:16S rRNA U516 pseudouridylate synthase RsuA-like enzyme
LIYFTRTITLIAINKPHGLLVHRSSIAADAEEFALQLLRDQIGKKVNPAHRIDRKTGGVLLFAFDKQTEIAMQQAFMENRVSKKYLAIVRGYTPDELEIDYPLRKENGTLQDALTRFTTTKTRGTGRAAGQASNIQVFAGTGHAANGAHAPVAQAFRAHISPHYWRSYPWLQQAEQIV